MGKGNQERERERERERESVCFGKGGTRGQAKPILAPSSLWHEENLSKIKWGSAR